MEWNRDRTTAECEIANRIVVRYKIGMLRASDHSGRAVAIRIEGESMQQALAVTVPYRTTAPVSVVY